MKLLCGGSLNYPNDSTLCMYVIQSVAATCFSSTYPIFVASLAKENWGLERKLHLNYSHQYVKYLPREEKLRTLNTVVERAIFRQQVPQLLKWDNFRRTLFHHSANFSIIIFMNFSHVPQ